MVKHPSSLQDEPERNCRGFHVKGLQRCALWTLEYLSHQELVTLLNNIKVFVFDTMQGFHVVESSVNELGVSEYHSCFKYKFTKRYFFNKAKNLIFYAYSLEKVVLTLKGQNVSLKIELKDKAKTLDLLNLKL